MRCTCRSELEARAWAAVLSPSTSRCQAPLPSAEAADALTRPGPAAPRGAARAALLGRGAQHIEGDLLEGGAVAHFGGLPYAAPPTGSLRWRRPVPPTPEGAHAVLDCTSARRERRARPLQDTDEERSEDSLVLDVWAPWPPAGGRLHPVVACFPGAGFVHEAGSDADGLAYARDHGLVFVSVQYRLGALGWLHPRGGDANCGLWDMVEALRWLQLHARAFGGEAASVTVLGHGAAADALLWLCSAPAAAGLFDRAVLMSPGTLALASADQAEELAEDFASQVRGQRRGACLEDLRELGAEQLLEAQRSEGFGLDPTLVPGWRTQGGPPASPPPQGPASVSERGSLLVVPRRSWPAPSAVVDGELLLEQPLDRLAALPLGSGLGRVAAVIIGAGRAEAGRDAGSTADEAWDAARWSLRSRTELVDRLMWEFAGCSRAALAARSGWCNAGLRAACERLLGAYDAELPGASPDRLWEAVASDLGASCMVQLAVARLSRLLPGRVWQYQFEGFEGHRAFHGCERPLVFGQGGQPPTSGPPGVGSAWTAAWASFALRGDPNAAAGFAAAWPPCSPGAGSRSPVLRIDGASGAWLGDLRSRAALRRCAELVEHLFMLRQPDAGHRPRGRPADLPRVEVACADCAATGSAAEGLPGSAWICGGCWGQRRRFQQRHGALCTECGTGAPAGGQPGTASMCRPCAQRLRPRDLRWREAASVYWVQPEAPQGLLACSVCRELTDRGGWLRASGAGVATPHAGSEPLVTPQQQEAWVCSACRSRCEAGAPAGGAAGTPPYAPLWALAGDPAGRQRGTIVSLGSWCGVKAALRGLALGGPTLPFDWIRISMEGLLAALRDDFAGFLSFDSISDSGTTYVARHHRFFHDVLDDPRDVDKYHRRFNRFRGLRDAGVGGRRGPLLFVRAVDTTRELARAAELHGALRAFFDDSAHLLLLLDCQASDRTVLFEEHPRLQVRLVSRAHASPREYEIDRPPFVTAYRGPILDALWQASCGWRPGDALVLPNADALCGDRTGLLRHVSLGEDLERYNYGIPQLPPDEVLLQAMHSEGRCTRELVAAAVRSRAEWERDAGALAPRSRVAEDFERWMAAFPE